jgi:hypothetical protein
MLNRVILVAYVLHLAQVWQSLGEQQLDCIQPIGANVFIG